METNNSIQVVQHDAGCALLEGVYEQDCYTNDEPDFDEDFDGDFELFDYDPEAEIQRMVEIIEHLAADLGKDPSIPIAGQGPTVFIGFDSEFVPGDQDNDNTILSLQFYIIGEREPYSRVIYPTGDSKADRPSFKSVIVQLLLEAIEKGAILEWPKMVVVCGFFLRIDLQAFGDLSTFKNDLENVGGRVASVKSSVTVLATDRDGIFRNLKVRFIDVGGHVAMGTSLAQVGDLLGFPKLELPNGYTKGRMDLFLAGDKPAFEQYGLRDAEIAVRFYLRLLDFSKEVTGKWSLPATASSLAVTIFMNQLKESGVNFNAAFGVEETSSTCWSATTSSVVTRKDKSPIPMRSMLEPFAASCYSGGRNECYVFGPTDVGVYNDYDLAGAYTTGMVDLRHIDYENFWITHDPADFVGHVLGFAYVKFAFPEGTRFPSLPVRNRDNGLVYPLTGFSYCTAPEIEVALNLGCDIEIKHGIVIPWLDGDDRLFEPYVLGIRKLRARFVKGSLDELYAKLLGNGLYGKTAQGLKMKTVFEAKTMKSVELPKSVLTNAAIAAHTTGFIRAVLSEQIASIPSHRNVISATTDGFLTDADESELILDGPMARRFQGLCERVAPGSKMLERKHKVRQLIAMKTRGQITAMPFDDEPIILAKAGVSPGIDADLHNDYMIDLFMCRTHKDMAITWPFTPFREQWVKDADVVRLKRKTKLNLEFDHKRRLVSPRMVAVDQCEHVSLVGVPWNDLAECERARAIFNGWRRLRCLRTLDDFEDWEDHYLFSLVRDRLQKSGVKGFGIRATNKGVVDVFRRLFLRAYAQGLCGLTKAMTYGALADWLTEKGYETKADDLKNAKRDAFVENAVPPTRRVLKLAAVLVEGFPSIEINKFIESN
ncbi:DNA polymerase [Sulfuriferula sp.]|uniref:DNA polymerase n=1 Tax=Sulfuriferula sp. TaxID=2025307 RepID=UPI002731C952|nr:DNA polymerase [Sulfuriferula sp.]MDP2025608.1 DNA polymerase [Sulfuriferula sp.]